MDLSEKPIISQTYHNQLTQIGKGYRKINEIVISMIY